MKDKKIILLGGRAESTDMVFNALNRTFGIETVIIEEKESLKLFLRRRIKRLGIITVLGQISFQIFIPKVLNAISKNRKKEIIELYNLDITDISKEKVKLVKSVNAQSTIELIKEINPDLIIVNGTRIISKKVLQSVSCKFINTHAGITPMYRGVHGTYWALVNNDIENSGVTVHFVDEGIDTGNIIEQKKVEITSKDNFVTYPLLQVSNGIEILISSIKNCFNGNITILNKTGLSNLYYHPTIWQYLYYRIIRKVK